VCWPRPGTDAACPRVVPEKVTGPFIDLCPPATPPSISTKHGQTMPNGSALLLLTASANRDERTFPDGDTFDIHRHIDRQLAFGYGIRFCLGSALARREGRVALEEVLARFADWEVNWDNAVQAGTQPCARVGAITGHHVPKENAS
jgi:hypothetical protein